MTGAFLLLHGQPGLGRDWAAVRTRLEGHQVLAPDRPGYGDTGGRAMGLLENADAAIALLDEVGVERAVIAGHSLGGGIALAAAQRHPARVAGLVLVASIGTRGSLTFLDRILAWPVIGPRLAFVGFRYLGRFLTLAPTGTRSGPFGPELAALQAEPLNDRLQRWQAEQVWEPFSVEQRAMVAELPGICDRISDIRVPAVVVAGRRDSIVAPAASRELAEALPGAELRWVDGGHLLPFEAPDAVAQALLDVARAGQGGGEPDPPPAAQGCVS